MRTIDQIYRENLDLLIKEGGTLDAFAAKIGKAPSQVSQWRNASKDSKTGKPRTLSRHTARHIETVCDKPEGWMDQSHTSPQPEASTPAPLEFAGVVSGMRPVVVVGTARLAEGDEGYYDEISSIPGAGDGHIEIQTIDPNAYCLRVRGNSMAPAIRDGWYVLVEPNGNPVEGEFVLVKRRNGQKLVKEFLYRRGDSVELLSVNGQRRLTIYNDELESLQPVSAVVSPSKWKPD